MWKVCYIFCGKGDASGKAALCFVRFVGTGCAVSDCFCSKKNPVENIPPECFQDYSTASGTQGRCGLVRSALEKLSLFSPTFSVRQKHGAGNFAVCGQRLRGHVPSKGVYFASRRMQIAPSDFSRDERKSGGNPLWISEYFPEISRKRCKQDACEKIQNRL